MNLAEQVYQTVKPLPEARVQEVLDFANIVESKLKGIGIKTTVDKDDTHSLGYKINE
jgi:hypothetical protein